MPQSQQHNNPAISMLQHLYLQPSLLGQLYIQSLSQTIETVVVDTWIDHFVFVRPHQEETQDPASMDYTHLQHWLSRVVALLLEDPPKQRTMTLRESQWPLFHRIHCSYDTATSSGWSKQGTRYKVSVQWHFELLDEILLLVQCIL